MGEEEAPHNEAHISSRGVDHYFFRESGSLQSQDVANAIASEVPDGYAQDFLIRESHAPRLEITHELSSSEALAESSDTFTVNFLESETTEELSFLRPSGVM